MKYIYNLNCTECHYQYSIDNTIRKNIPDFVDAGDNWFDINTKLRCADQKKKIAMHTFTKYLNVLSAIIISLSMIQIIKNILGLEDVGDNWVDSGGCFEPKQIQKKRCIMVLINF